jgi:hypothetical protein
VEKVLHKKDNPKTTNLHGCFWILFFVGRVGLLGDSQG